MYSGSGTGTSTTYYAAYNRLISNNNPSLQCSDSADIYTTSGSSMGNGMLMYPVGLISADEVVLSGGSRNSGNTSCYLYTGLNYWTISPSYYDSSSYVFVVDMDGYLYYNRTSADNDVRPVINLRSDIALSGSGTISDPFVVVS